MSGHHEAEGGGGREQAAEPGQGQHQQAEGCLPHRPGQRQDQLTTNQRWETQNVIILIMKLLHKIYRLCTRQLHLIL